MSMVTQQINTMTSLVAQLVKILPGMWETWVRSLGWEDPLEKETATHSSILAWRIPWTVYSPWDCRESDMAEQLSLTLYPQPPIVQEPTGGLQSLSCVWLFGSHPFSSLSFVKKSSSFFPPLYSLF